MPFSTLATLGQLMLASFISTPLFFSKQTFF